MNRTAKNFLNWAILIAAWKKCKHIFEGIAETNGQEHLYIETQGAYAIPQENNGIKVYSSTQGPTAAQQAHGRCA
ncbi:MAG: molybdopterin cofactor-binding domain-containing protein [Chitinophagaceae bacterium]